MTTYHLRGTDGTEVFTGTIEPPPGSGSQPGDVAELPFTFGTANLSTNAGYAITAASAGDQSVSVDGDHTAELPVGTNGQITGSSEMDGAYQVVSAAFVGGKTVVTVTGSTSDIADGFLHPSIGAVFYTPTDDDVAAGLWLLDAWLQLGTAWDGITPRCDIGTFLGSFNSTDGAGLFSISAALPLDLAPDVDAGGYLCSTSFSSLVGAGAASNGRVAPGRITGTNPLRVLVSSDGTATGSDPGAAQGAATLCYRIGRKASS